MRVTNHLPHLLDCLRRWEAKPSRAAFAAEYFAPLVGSIGTPFDDGADRLYGAVEGLNWAMYREEALRLDPSAEEARLRRQLGRVEELFGLTLEGDVVLFGAFTRMDGYARFDRGKHVVYLGVDESHGRGAYLDVLESHELTHVVRESRPEVWAGWGLSLDMTHDDFVEQLPVVEHLLNEGFACVVSELLNPGEDPWHYAYQTEDSLARVLEHGPFVDRVVREELALGPEGDYGRLYAPGRYGRGMPQFTHYVWAWQWARHVLDDLCGGDARALAARCSKDLVDDARAFQLERLR